MALRAHTGEQSQHPTHPRQQGLGVGGPPARVSPPGHGQGLSGEGRVPEPGPRLDGVLRAERSSPGCRGGTPSTHPMVTHCPGRICSQTSIPPSTLWTLVCGPGGACTGPLSAEHLLLGHTLNHPHIHPPCGPLLCPLPHPAEECPSPRSCLQGPAPRWFLPCKHLKCPPKPVGSPSRDLPG